MLNNLLRKSFLLPNLIRKTQHLLLPSTLSHIQFRSYYGPRPAEVPTHRNELLPFTQNNIWDNPQAIKRKKRLGRGRASGKGKTSGHGHKGQGQRRGRRPAVGFEGGQTPLQKRLPKYGRRPINQTPYTTISIKTILYFIKRGFLNPNEPITLKNLYEIKAIGVCKFGCKVLAMGAEELDFPLHLEVSDITKQA